jgi:hypothetical protein
MSRSPIQVTFSFFAVLTTLFHTDTGLCGTTANARSHRTGVRDTTQHYSDSNYSLSVTHTCIIPEVDCGPGCLYLHFAGSRSCRKLRK